MKIYTRTGDDGTTGLFAGGRTRKDDARLHAYGTIDELNATLGLVIANDVQPELAAMVTAVQHELFSVGADLATPLDADAEWITRVSEDQVTRLESEIDRMEDALPELKNFILPQGTRAAATLHIARTVCRRAERWLVTLSAEEQISPNVAQYVNRLSDWLFVAARYENQLSGRPETVWTAPKKGQQTDG